MNRYILVDEMFQQKVLKDLAELKTPAIDDNIRNHKNIFLLGLNFF
jgi:hypothetical protein